MEWNVSFKQLERQFFDRDTDRLTNQWKIFTANSRRARVPLYIVRSLISWIHGNVISFLRTLWIWHGLSFGQHQTVVGAPWTTHRPFAQSVFWPVPTPTRRSTHNVQRGWYWPWPPVALWICPVQKMDLQDKHPLVELKVFYSHENKTENYGWYLVQEFHGVYVPQ